MRAVADFALLALSPRWYPKWLWRIQVSPLRVIDELGGREVAWGDRVTLAIRPGTHTLTFQYNAVNQPWTRTPTLPVDGLDQQLVTYRTTSLGIVRRPKITIAPR